MAALELEAPARGRGSLLGRIAAWWDGDDEPAAARPAPPPPSLPASSSASSAGDESVEALDRRNWSADRIEAAATLFGPGWLSPGGSIFGDIVKPLCLDASHSVVLHGAAAGGAAQVVAQETGAWVDALEERAPLALEATRHLKAVGLGKKIVVHPTPPETATIKQRSRHAAISFEALHRAPDRDATLASLRAMLRPAGQLLVTDFVQSGPASGPLSRWLSSQPEGVRLVGPDELKSQLERQGLAVRVLDDCGESYGRAALGALQSLLRALECDPAPVRLRSRLLWEIEALTQLLRALENRSLSYIRCHALAPGAPVER